MKKIMYVCLFSCPVGMINLKPETQKSRPPTNVPAPSYQNITSWTGLLRCHCRLFGWSVLGQCSNTFNIWSSQAHQLQRLKPANQKQPGMLCFGLSFWKMWCLREIGWRCTGCSVHFSALKELTVWVLMSVLVWNLTFGAHNFGVPKLPHTVVRSVFHLTLLQLESCLCSCCFLRVIWSFPASLGTSSMYKSWVSWFFAYVMVWSVSPFSFTMLPFKTHTSKKIKKSQSPSIWQLLRLRRLRRRRLFLTIFFPSAPDAQWMLSGLGTIHVHQVVGQPRGLLGARNVSNPRSNWLASLWTLKIFEEGLTWS